MDKAFRILGWIVTTALGVFTGSLIVFVAAIDPPPYPYFDWEPYFDQAYEEHGCEGAEWFAITASVEARLQGPSLRYAGLVQSGECADIDGNYSDSELLASLVDQNDEPDGSFDESLAHYAHHLDFNLGRAINHFVYWHDQPGLNFEADLGRFILRCGSEDARSRYHYAFRKWVAEHYDSTLQMPAWEARNRECADLLLEEAREFRQSQPLTPRDQDSRELRQNWLYWLRQGSRTFNSPELYRLEQSWQMSGFLVIERQLVFSHACPAEWRDFVDLYRRQSRYHAMKTALGELGDALAGDARIAGGEWIQKEIVAELHAQGHILPQSDEWAYYWQRRAINEGSPNMERLERFGAALSTERRAEIDRLAAANELLADRPEALTYFIRRQYLRYLSDSQHQHSEVDPATYGIAEDWLAETDRAQAHTVVDERNWDAWPEWPEHWPQAPDWNAIDWVDCDTGEPVAYPR